MMFTENLFPGRGLFIKSTVMHLSNDHYRELYIFNKINSVQLFTFEAESCAALTITRWEYSETLEKKVSLSTVAYFFTVTHDSQTQEAMSGCGNGPQRRKKNLKPNSNKTVQWRCKGLSKGHLMTDGCASAEARKPKLYTGRQLSELSPRLSRGHQTEGLGNISLKTLTSPCAKPVFIWLPTDPEWCLCHWVWRAICLEY